MAINYSFHSSSTSKVEYERTKTETAWHFGGPLGFGELGTGFYPPALKFRKLRFRSNSKYTI
jgi:hypothetical protein